MDVREWDNLKSTKHFEDLLEFPCSFHIKVICRSGGWVQQALVWRAFHLTQPLNFSIND